MSAAVSTFAEIVVQECIPLIAPFCLCVAQRNDRTVRFTSSKVYITFYLTRYSEVQATFGRLVDEAAGREGFGVFALLNSVDKNFATAFRVKVANNAEEMTEGVRVLVGILQKYGKDVLAGQDRAFRQLSTQRLNRSELYGVETVAEHVRPKAEAAFREGNYAKAAELYQSIRRVLTEVELRKLTIAEKKVRGDTAS